MSFTVACMRHAGKSECSRCQSATGRFCRACLLVRYGVELEAVRAEMDAGAWLCPHCYEEDHPDEVRLAPPCTSEGRQAPTSAPEETLQ